MYNPYEGIPGPEWDPNSPIYGRDPGSTASSLLNQIGVEPDDGWTVRARMAPEIKEGQTGYWVMTNPGSQPNQAGRDGVPEPYMPQVHGAEYRYVDQPRPAPAPVQALPTEDDPAPDGPTIYDSTADWIRIARAEDQGRNRMPFVGPNWSTGNKTYADVPYNPLLSLEMFYPSAQNEFQQNNKSPYEGGLLSESLGGMGGGGMSSLGNMVRSGLGMGTGSSSSAKAPGTSYDLRKSLR